MLWRAAARACLGHCGSGKSGPNGCARVPVSIGKVGAGNCVHVPALPVSRPPAYIWITCQVSRCPVGIDKHCGFHDAECKSGQHRVFCIYHRLVYFLAIYRMVQAVEHDV